MKLKKVSDDDREKVLSNHHIREFRDKCLENAVRDFLNSCEVVAEIINERDWSVQPYTLSYEVISSYLKRSGNDKYVRVSNKMGRLWFILKSESEEPVDRNPKPDAHTESEKPVEKKPYYPIKGVAKMFNVSPRAVLQWIKTGRLEAEEIHVVKKSRYRVAPKAIVRFTESDFAVSKGYILPTYLLFESGAL